MQPASDGGSLDAGAHHQYSCCPTSRHRRRTGRQLDGDASIGCFTGWEYNPGIAAEEYGRRRKTDASSDHTEMFGMAVRFS